MSECILWQGAKSPLGYGMRWLGGGTTTTAHRVAWIKAYGPIPDGLVVRHKCDNRLCVNLEHLELGTQQENVDDMFARGRWKKRGKTIRNRRTEVVDQRNCC